MKRLFITFNPFTMKKLMTILLVVLVSLQAIGQKKGKVDPKDLKIDSLTKASAAMTLQMDSINKDLATYKGVYTTLKEKVFKYSFDPAKTSNLIDSLRKTRDSTFSTSTAILKDSLSVVTKKNVKLQATIDSLGMSDSVKAKTVSDLKQLKELLDAKIITQAEFDAKKTKLLEKL
jgi:hypothetical protein